MQADPPALQSVLSTQRFLLSHLAKVAAGVAEAGVAKARFADTATIRSAIKRTLVIFLLPRKIRLCANLPVLRHLSFTSVLRVPKLRKLMT
jgi:hypothetical protein